MRFRKIHYIAAFMAALFLPLAVWGQSLNVVATTADVTVAGSVTSSVTFPGGPIDWISIKNECSDDVYFDIAGRQDYPVRLSTSESFTAHMKTFSVGVSNGGNSTCTFSIAAGRF